MRPRQETPGRFTKQVDRCGRPYWKRLLSNCGFCGSWCELTFGSTWRIAYVARKHPPVLAELLERHVHDFERHVLRTGVAHKRRGLQVPQANLQPQLDLRPGSQVPAQRGDASRQAGGLD